MAKAPYVPPVLHGRISRDGLGALEPVVPLAADFDARLVLPALDSRFTLELGGVALAVAADGAVAAYVAAALGEWAVADGAAGALDVHIASVARLPIAESVTRLVVGEDGGILRATQRGLMARVDGPRGEVRALVESATLAQDIANLVRVLLSLYAPEHGGVLFRATAVAHGEKALLFAGPMLAGKTTVARLSAGRDILSDDGVVLSVAGNAVRASSVGLWGGETASRALRRRELPVAAIFGLRKAAVNRVAPLARGAAAMELAAAVPLVSRRGELSRRVLDLAAAAAAVVPVYELAFSHRDASFWELVERAT